MIPTYWNNVVGYLVGTSIAVIGLYIAFVLPIILRWRAGDEFERGAWNLGNHYKWINPLAILWIVLICILFLMPIAPTGIPWKTGFDWNVVNYAPITVGGALAPLRRLVHAVGAQVVQGPGPRGHRGRARAHRGRLRRRVRAGPAGQAPETRAGSGAAARRRTPPAYYLPFSVKLTQSPWFLNDGSLNVIQPPSLH